MNHKGNIGLAAALIVTAIIGIYLVDQVALPIWTATTVTNESLGVVGNYSEHTLANNCLAAAPTSVYDWTNGTEVNSSMYTLSPGTYPNRIANTINFTDENFDANDTVIGVNYTYGCEYGSNSIIRLIMANFAILVGVAALTLAGGWLYLKG